MRKAFLDMNRLVIIGNGFDLAHGLPTSYKDFIEDYLVEKANVFLNERVYEDTLLSIKLKERVSLDSIPKFKNINEVINFFKNSNRATSFSYKSIFFESLKNKIDKITWVDIESEYFENILKCKDRHGFFDYSKVTKLNNEFEYLKKLLEIYLLKLKPKSIKLKGNYRRLFCDLIKKEDVVFKEIEQDNLPKQLLFLNFNYTNTISNYYSECNRVISSEINYIHGALQDMDNPIIFGFGDEYDKNYKNFEDEKNNILFKHIKSFNYFKTQNYHNLIRFIDSDDFQVYIFGHSCGLSDRTMLKEIFENEKCISIKIFYYKEDEDTNDYVEKTMEIARHFEDKGLMRKKIVPFPLSNSM